MRDLYPVPKTEAEKREVLRAGYLATCRLLAALEAINEHVLDTRDGPADCAEILLESALENASLLLQMVDRYLPKMVDIDIANDSNFEGSIEEAYRKILSLRRSGQFAA